MRIFKSQLKMPVLWRMKRHSRPDIENGFNFSLKCLVYRKVRRCKKSCSAIFGSSTSNFGPKLTG